MKGSLYKICPKCKRPNINRDYCEYCGTIINIYLKRRLERRQQEDEKRRLEKESGKIGFTTFFENAREHPNWFIRIFAKLLYSVWVVVIAIGSFLAFLLGYVAA